MADIKIGYIASQGMLLPLNILNVLLRTSSCMVEQQPVSLLAADYSLRCSLILSNHYEQMNAGQGITLLLMLGVGYKSPPHSHADHPLCRQDARPQIESAACHGQAARHEGKRASDWEVCSQSSWLQRRRAIPLVWKLLLCLAAAKSARWAQILLSFCQYDFPCIKVKIEIWPDLHFGQMQHMPMTQKHKIMTC